MYVYTCYCFCGLETLPQNEITRIALILTFVTFSPCINKLLDILDVTKCDCWLKKASSIERALTAIYGRTVDLILLRYRDVWFYYELLQFTNKVL